MDRVGQAVDTGFTALELLVTMAVASVLVAVAVPSFSSITATQRARTTASDLFASLLKTRSEAIMRNANVTLAPVGGSWDGGWQIPDPANGAIILESHEAPTAVTITGPASVVYRPSGRVVAAPSFLVTTTSGSVTNYQCISVDLSGRPYSIDAQTC